MPTTRTRTSDNQVISRFYATAPGQPEAVYVSGFVGDTATVNDNNNTEFRRIRDSGGVLLSDCSVTKWARVVTPGSGSNQFGYSVRGDSFLITGGGAHGNFTVPPSEMMESSDQLLIKLYAKINSSALLSGESVRDFGQTLSMLKHPFKSASSLLSQMVKFRSRRLGKTTQSVLKATSDSWLEYRYGWKPLLMDVNTVIQEAHRKRDNLGQRRLVVRSGSSFETSKTGTWTNQPDWLNAKTSGTEVYRRNCRRGVGVLYDVHPHTNSQHLQQVLGVRLRDVPATVWEIVPYSFVVDWFVGVGDWIQAITPNPAVTIRGHWATTVNEVRTTRSGSWSEGYTGSLGSEEVYNFTYSRVCNQPISVTPVWKINPMTRLHQADAAALLLKPVLATLRSFAH